MKNLLAVLFFLFPIIANCQTVVYSDNMESSGWTWKGIPKTLINSYYIGGNSNSNDNPANAPLYSSSDSCFALFGTGLGSSAVEKDTLGYANVTGLDPNTYYQIRFKICSVGINPSGNAAAGVDGSDYVQLEYSSNGGTTFTKEIKFVGASNSMWGFPGGLQVTKTANGSLNTFTYVASSPTTSIGLNLPVGITQLAFNLIMATNATGETWMVDDVQLVALTALPIELVAFSVRSEPRGNLLSWTTASESNNDYFSIQCSEDGMVFHEVGRVDGSWNSTSFRDYSFLDMTPCLSTLYYRLCQVDFDGKRECFEPIAAKCSRGTIKRIVKVVNPLGQEIEEGFDGLRIMIFQDGTTEMMK